jgi:hypothetical protein
MSGTSRDEEQTLAKPDFDLNGIGIAEQGRPVELVRGRTYSPRTLLLEGRRGRMRRT